MRGETKPITDDELLYRRIPAGYYRQNSLQPIEEEAFRPRERENAGLSLGRASFLTPEQFAALGRKGKDFYIAVLCAGELRTQGMKIVPTPLADNPGHAEISNLTYDNRRKKKQEEWQKYLATKLCQDVLGPFPGKKPTETM